MSLNEDIAHNLRRVQEDIEVACRDAGRDASEVTLIAVSKTHPVPAIRAAHAAGARHLGENKAQELARKAPELHDLDLEWHMIGHLQSNKVRSVLPWCGLIHSVDRLSLVEEIQRRASDGDSARAVRVLIQVNTTGEASKSGLGLDDVEALLESVLGAEALRLEGFMTMGPLEGSEAENRAAFSLLRTVRDRMAARCGLELPTLSMGMSGDFREAILEGATHVRVGTRIFGARDYA